MYNKVLLSYKQEENHNICNNLVELRGHYGK